MQGFALCADIAYFFEKFALFVRAVRETS